MKGPGVRELAGILGAAFFGAFVQGIVTELTKDSIDATPVSIYLSMGFVGMAAVFLSVR